MPAGSLRDVDWEVIPPSPHAAHLHMALDEVLLERVIAGRRPATLRIWQWTQPTLVIGSHQSVLNEVDVAAATEMGFVITRRMSGGGTMLCEAGRTITYSLYCPESVVAGMSFRASYAALDGWAVRAFAEIGVPASYREINDIISPRGKIGGAAQARRRGFVLHHTTLAHAMDVNLVSRLIRIRRERISEKGVRSAEKEVSPLAWFTALSCDEVSFHLFRCFQREVGGREGSLSGEELEAAQALVSSKYSTVAWINRLP